MAEYIERRALMEDARHDKAIMANLAGIADIANLINDQPTADVVEVVRCKDCKYFIPDKCLDHTKYPNYLEADGLCGNIDKYTDEDRFCSSGAKMDGKGEGE